MHALRNVPECLKIGLGAYVCTSLPVFIGIQFGLFLLKPSSHSGFVVADYVIGCSRFDGLHYTRIAEQGYDYDVNRRSDVAFFPVYPLSARAFAELSGLEARLSLLIVSNICLVLSFVAIVLYERHRSERKDAGRLTFILAGVGLCPMSLFFRMTYSESEFLLCTVAFLFGTARRSDALGLALLAGLSSAIRPVGLALTAAWAWRIISDPAHGSKIRRIFLALVMLPIACWGLLAYMTYQQGAFDNPLAFAQTQKHWKTVLDNENFWDKAESLLSGEPIWGAYSDDPIRNWARIDGHDSWLFSLTFWNPIFFVGALSLVVLGAFRSWLTSTEVVLGVGLLAIPYLTRAYEFSMLSHARFASVVVPAYIVLGRLLSSIPSWLAWGLLGVSSSMLTCWTALFVSGHRFF